MISRVKSRVTGAPTPMAGLALGIASLGWCWESFIDLRGYGQWSGAVVAAVLLIVLASKFLLHRHLLREDLAHPVVGSVVPTFAMGVMVVSNSLGQFYPLAGDALWLMALSLHIVFLSRFVYHRSQEFRLHHMVPSWFVPPVGIIVADVSFSGNPMLIPIANSVLMFGMLAYAFMLPIMLYRFMFTHEISDAAKPTIAIMAAPASLSLAGYLTVQSSPSPVVIGVLFGISILMTLLIYVAFFKLLRLPFSSGYAAFTFPTVISATALFKLASWMSHTGIEAKYVSQVHFLARFELIIATLVVGYVAARYLHFYQPHKGIMSNR
ncbi:TDT family transporter [Vibrio sp. ZSDE26]|uniref:TDT family transporter n=1 Tax=Vibrio amylolyticus TaxID=2847292 RepID=A0A9X2BG53_9VIBR|nr:TDT family transporter [Vibrio amylolyticus]MCK6262536.1 TDT family transporter [Vibrio amylolyticus]